MNAGLIAGEREGRETRQCSVHSHHWTHGVPKWKNIVVVFMRAQKSSPQNRLEARSKRCLLDPSREGPAMNQLSSEIRTLQDKVNALSEEKEFYDPETASSSGMSHVPSRIPSTRGLLGRDSGWPHFSRNSMGTSGNVF